jgi:hypothetical protein
MKKALFILLLAILAGCASPYNPVYVSDQGDYYIAEAESSYPYYPPGADALNHVDRYRNYWWVSGYFPGYSPPLFSYYSPYFYPHYFSVWSPGWSHYAGWYGGYSSWCPPYRMRSHDNPGLAGDGARHGAGLPVVYPMPATGVSRDLNPDLWRSSYRTYQKLPAAAFRTDYEPARRNHPVQSASAFGRSSVTPGFGASRAGTTVSRPPVAARSRGASSSHRRSIKGAGQSPRTDRE